MNKIVLLFGLLICSSGFGQTSRDSLLANERTMDRPINVHRGQLRITGGYGFEYINTRYDEDGISTRLKSEGLARAHHTSALNIKYGIFEFLQLSAQIGYESQNVRTKQVAVVGYPDDNSVTAFNSTTKVAGITDLDLGLDFRFPFKTRKIDLLLSAAVTLPTSSAREQHPDYNLTKESVLYNVEYKYREPAGKGSAAIRVGGAFKYRLKNVAFTLKGDYSNYLQQSSMVDWQVQFTNTAQIKYLETNYSLFQSDILRANFNVEYQVKPYFNFFAEGNFYQTFKGWTDLYGTESLPVKEAISIGPGFELIITPRLWFRETVQIPVTGSNIDQGLLFYSTLSYNLFIVK